ncbi:MAG TPA: hypothetical protein DIC36_03370 [Gammaproteobacteria bacterium]|nr:hypothetical protein [Gammaproteobacteria bacterium]
MSINLKMSEKNRKNAGLAAMSKRGRAKVKNHEGPTSSLRVVVMTHEQAARKDAARIQSERLGDWIAKHGEENVPEELL